MQRTPLLFFRAVPGVGADPDGRAVVPPQKLSFLRMVATLEAQSCCHRVLLNIRSAVSGGAPRAEVLEEFLAAWLRARAPTSMRKEFR